MKTLSRSHTLLLFKRHPVPYETALYTVSTTSNRISPKCLTCDTKSTKSKDCSNGMAHVSPSGSKYLHFCHGLNVPEIYIRDAKSSEIVAILESGTKVEQQGYPVFFDTYPLPGGFLAYTKMLVPSNYNPSGSYPVVVETYGGPGYGMVDSDTGFSWERVLVDTFNIVYIFIDGRGTGYQSNDHMFQMYLGLGTVA